MVYIEHDLLIFNNVALNDSPMRLIIFILSSSILIISVIWIYLSRSEPEPYIALITGVIGLLRCFPNKRKKSNSGKMENQKLRDEATTLLHEGKVSESIALIRQNVPSNNEITLISSRYNRNEKQFNSGLIDYNSYNLELNRISSSLASIIRDMSN